MEAVYWDGYSQTSSLTNLGLTICFCHVCTFRLCWRSRGLAYQILLVSFFLVCYTASGLDLVSQNSSIIYSFNFFLNHRPEYPDVSLIPSLLAQLSSYSGEHG